MLTFDPTHWAYDGAQQGRLRVYVFAEDDPRSEGDRTVVVQHSVISADARFDGADVRQVNVRVYDNDTPGVYVTPVEPSAACTANANNCVLDDRNLTIEGFLYGGTTYTGRLDAAARPAGQGARGR